jgi:hypothetical protein
MSSWLKLNGNFISFIMSYNAYVVAFIGAPRDHHTIFIETNSDGSGYIYQVAGDIQNGMSHSHKPGKKPEDSYTFVSKEFIGTVSTANYPQVATICNGIPPPKKQFQGPRRLYPNEPLRRCQEWNGEAIQALKSAGVLES